MSKFENLCFFILMACELTALQLAIVAIVPKTWANPQFIVMLGTVGAAFGLPIMVGEFGRYGHRWKD